jgi:hypothetical protein
MWGKAGTSGSIGWGSNTPPELIEMANLRNQLYWKLVNMSYSIPSNVKWEDEFKEIDKYIMGLISIDEGYWKSKKRTDLIDKILA